MAQDQKTKPVSRKVPILKTSAFHWQSQGFHYREAFVRLPGGLTLQDLNDEPTLWRNIQGDPGMALQKFDKIRAVDFDEEWFVDATVSFADRNQVILCGLKKTSMPSREVAMFEDEHYRVDWAGSGYAVFRKSDGVQMGNLTFTNAEQAKSHLLAEYPARVS